MSAFIRFSPTTGQREPIDPPLVASPYDDEFDSSTLDPKWERVGTFNDIDPIQPFTPFTGGGARWSLTRRPSWFMSQADNTAGKALRQYISIPENCFIWSRMSFDNRGDGNANNENIILLRFEHDVTTDGAYVCLNENDLNVMSMQAVTRVGGTGTVIARTNNVGGAGATGQVCHTVGVQKLGTTYHFWAMSTAGSWLWLGSGVMPNPVNSIKLEWNVLAFVPPLQNSISGFDFFRFVEGKELP